MNEHDLKVLIVDDEPLARHWLRVQLGKCNLNLNISEAPSAALALKWLENNACDVILLDIHMPEIDGLEFAKRQAEIACTKPPAIIFVTADSAHALQAFELAAFDYLTKPVSATRLEEALKRVMDRTPVAKQENATPLNEPFVVVESHQQVARIPLSEVLYFHADSKYVKIFTKTQSHFIEDSLNTLEEQFQKHVIRIHRSYLVTLQTIEKIVRDDQNTHNANGAVNAWLLKLKNHEVYLPISRRQLPLVREALQQPIA